MITSDTDCYKCCGVLNGDGVRFQKSGTGRKNIWMSLIWGGNALDQNMTFDDTGC